MTKEEPVIDGWRPYYRGDGVPRAVELPDPPPWRAVSRGPAGRRLQPPEGLVEAVNAALHLRRPLLLTGATGWGKSAVLDSVAAELGLGEPLRWHVTSRSVLAEALYRYDALGRVHDRRLGADRPTEVSTAPAGDSTAPAGDSTAPAGDDISSFLRLGPLGSALVPGERPRALLIDEFDSSDLDLPGELLDVLERGEFEIPELTRHPAATVMVRDWAGDRWHPITAGTVRCVNPPVVVISSGGERDLSGSFLRRCVRFTMPRPGTELLSRVVDAHLGAAVADREETAELIDTFVQRLKGGTSLAVDQLLSAVFTLTGDRAPRGEARERIRDLLLRDVTRA